MGPSLTGRGSIAGLAWLAAAAATRWPFPFNLLVLRSSVWIDSGCGLCRYCHDVPPPSSVKLADLRMVRA